MQDLITRILRRLGLAPELLPQACTWAQAQTHPLRAAPGTVFVITDKGWSRWIARQGQLILAGTHPGHIMWWPSATPPAGWLVCDGATITAAQHPTLVATLGATYGGDGTTTASLPNLINRFALGGLPASIGQTGGAASQTVPLPQHSHTASAQLQVGTNAYGATTDPAAASYLYKSNPTLSTAAGIYGPTPPTTTALLSATAVAITIDATGTTPQPEISTLPPYAHLLPIIYGG